MKQIAASYCLHSEPLCSLEMIIYVRQWIKFLWKCVRQMQNTIYLEGQLDIGNGTYRLLLCSWNDPRERTDICEMVQNQRFLISWWIQEKKTTWTVNPKSHSGLEVKFLYNYLACVGNTWVWENIHVGHGEESERSSLWCLMSREGLNSNLCTIKVRISVDRAGK